MRIPEWIAKSVVFIGQRELEGSRELLKLRGTAFIVSIPFRNEYGDSRHLYLVTARHSILEIGGREHELRVNARGGRWKYIPVAADCRWWYPAESSDVAVRPFVADEAGETEFVPIPIDIMMTKENMHEYYIGQGDEVTVTGLFTKLAGESRNMPIVRRGTLAMIPEHEDKVTARFGDRLEDIEAYLIEVRSAGGLSGSPAFVRAPIGLHYNIHTRSGARRIAEAHIQGDYFLLGLVHGHWDIPSDQFNKVDFRIAGKKDEKINLGIAIVVPATKIIEALNHPELVAMRQEVERRAIEDGGTTTPD